MSTLLPLFKSMNAVKETVTLTDRPAMGGWTATALLLKNPTGLTR